MLRILAASCVLGLALGQTPTAQENRAAIILRDDVASALTASENLASKIEAAENAGALFGDAVQMVDASVGDRVADITKQLSNDESTANNMHKYVADKLDDTDKWIKSHLGTVKSQLDADVQDAVDKLEALINAQKDGIDAQLTNRLSTVVEDAGEIQENADTVIAWAEGVTACAVEGQFSDGDGDCVDAEVPENMEIAKVSYNEWDDDDGRENGFLTANNLNFDKHYDDTYLRIFWYENIRTHGHTANGRWNIFICDSGGGSCSHCSDPGKLQNWRHSSHQHNWWMNDHTGGTIFGLCKKTESFDLVKGKYQLKIYVDSAHYDMYTGHNQRGNFMVDEVMKY